MDEEIALFKEMGILDKKGEIKSRVNSRANSWSNSPLKINMRSRSNAIAIGYFTLRKYIKSVRTLFLRREAVQYNQNKQSLDKNLNRNQRYMSSSTSSIHETIRIGSQVHDKRTSQSTQHLSISLSHIKSKLPISPGKNGPQTSINPKRLYPIVCKPSISPIEDAKPGSAKVSTKPVPATKKTVKTAGTKPATYRLNSKKPSRNASRDPSPEKIKTLVENVSRPINGAA
ncbi:unnamed protein product [Euphydryas editha]|uniref:Uncharacterized protein n=1 Tax=Euphydryas editha TaxID=104508 RepID=A0AAU9UEF2_EUPED|nr:unnamed protein product [Euphydryas editha]